MITQVLVLNGPNLGRLGSREPEVYGSVSFDDLAVEVHLSNPVAREEFRHTSVVAGVAGGTVTGFGLVSYQLALQAIAELAAEAKPARSPGPELEPDPGDTAP